MLSKTEVLQLFAEADLARYASGRHADIDSKLASSVMGWHLAENDDRRLWRDDAKPPSGSLAGRGLRVLIRRIKMAKAKQICKKITIVVRSKNDGDIEEGVGEAVRLVKDGCLSGHDSNDTGAYYFEVTDEVDKKDWPA